MRLLPGRIDGHGSPLAQPPQPADQNETGGNRPIVGEGSEPVPHLHLRLLVQVPIIAPEGSGVTT